MARGKKGGRKVRTTTPTIVMEEDAWQELRFQALREKTTASAIIRRLVADYLKKQKGGKRE
jgi:hypothetical protein